jgi:hypothetical protein
MRPSFWAHNVDQIGIDDYIEVVTADKQFAFRYIVKGKDPGLGLLLEPDFASMPGSPAHTALLRIQNAVRAETDAEHAELNRKYGIQP